MKCSLAVLLAYLAIHPAVSTAVVHCLPPTPYTSIEDSPFDLSGLGSTFFVEDMEQGITTISGVYLTGPSGFAVGPAELREPGPFTDSVDADDGLVDGFGNGGHSVVPSTYVDFPTFPITYQSFIDFFVEGNALGFVWTDGFHVSDLAFQVHGQGMPLGGCNYENLMDSSNTGETSEDRFLGLIADEPFFRVTVRSRSTGFEPVDERFEFDHVQFGFQPVPEPVPSVFAFLFLCLIALAAIRWNSNEAVR
jgi:hypothetical protein